jgi:hypothetical protein
MIKKIDLNKKNTERDTSNTYKVTVVAFTRIRTDTENVYISEDELHNPEKQKFSDSFFPTMEMVNKNGSYIRNHLLVYTNHQKTENDIFEGKKTKRPGWMG